MDVIMNILQEVRPRPDVCILLLLSAADGVYTVHRTINHGIPDHILAPDPRKTFITTHDRGLAEKAFADEVAKWKEQ